MEGPAVFQPYKNRRSLDVVAVHPPVTLSQGQRYGLHRILAISKIGVVVEDHILPLRSPFNARVVDGVDEFPGLQRARPGA